MTQEQDKITLQIEHDVFGEENSTLYIEALSKKDVKFLKKFEKMLQKALKQYNGVV